VNSRSTIRARSGEHGYALLLAAFIGTLMLITVMMAAPNIRTIRKRELEKEMIWRGNQYVRGIKMYYRKNGKFPTSLEDLTRPQVANIRFMRQSYKDPMNTEDGSWRLIYVGPNGQLIGSLKPQPTIVMQAGGTIGAPASNINGATVGGPLGAPASGAGSQTSAFGSQAFGTQGSGQNAGQNAGQGAVSADTDANGLPIGSQAVEPTVIIGGNIIGVGSKANGKSVIIYDQAPNYRLFEFYWDPSKDLVQFGAQPNIPGTSTPGTPAGAQPGTNPRAPSANPLGGTNPQDPSGPPTQGNPPQQ
jgi:hypothetical protein